jgi:hypothetical protein
LAHERGSRDPGACRDDAGLHAWVRSLEGKPVFKGIEAESVSWVSAFSKSTIALLDYVQADALGMPDRLGKPMQIGNRISGQRILRNSWIAT